MTIQLGQTVKDDITGFEGIAVARTEWLNGCVRIAVQPRALKDGKPQDHETFDEVQLQIIDEKAVPKAESRHGPQPEICRAPDAPR